MLGTIGSPVAESQGNSQTMALRQTTIRDGDAIVHNHARRDKAGAWPNRDRRIGGTCPCSPSDSLSDGTPLGAPARPNQVSCDEPASLRRATPGRLADSKRTTMPYLPPSLLNRPPIRAKSLRIQT